MRYFLIKTLLRTTHVCMHLVLVVGTKQFANTHIYFKDSLKIITRFRFVNIPTTTILIQWVSSFKVVLYFYVSFWQCIKISSRLGNDMFTSEKDYKLVYENKHRNRLSFCKSMLNKNIICTDSSRFRQKSARETGNICEFSQRLELGSLLFHCTRESIYLFAICYVLILSYRYVSSPFVSFRLKRIVMWCWMLDVI